MSDTIIEVAVPLPVFETYTYALPARLEVEPGGRVLVPCGGRRVTAVVLATGLSGPLYSGGKGLRSVIEVVDAEPALPPSLLGVVLRAAQNVLCPPGVALAAALPPGTAPRVGRRVTLKPPGRRALERGEARGLLGKVLWSLGRKPLPESALRRRFKDVIPALQKLERIGWIERTTVTEAPRVSVLKERIYSLAPGRDLESLRSEHAHAHRRLDTLKLLSERARPLPASASLRRLIELGHVTVEEREVKRGEILPALREPEPVPVLTPHQREAVALIGSAIHERQERGFLLYGITGSGKTEVYLRVSEQVLEAGRAVIILVPEISLTHQIVDRFRARFGDRVAVLHSGLSAGERFDQWRQIRAGRTPIVIGARSAIFAPLEELGLIVVDEEHDPAYKSDEGFRYHAREIAELRARTAGCPWVLGSATPDVASMHRSISGEIERLTLPERVAERPLPTVEIVDMSDAPRPRGRRAILSRSLRTAMAETLAAGQQTILFLNRRGFASMSYCFNCGHSLRCKHCDVALVYHASEGERRSDTPEEGELRCHYCGYQEAPSLRCASCESTEGALLGFGTERLEEEVGLMFPHARVARLDRDTSARKGAQRRILAEFHRGEIDILVGTQMVAKGHDIPGVTLVGVVAADLGLHFPDFRAGERTFQLLTQVAGRAGRGEEPGRVVIQTFLPGHYAIALARTHDYPSFYREEIRRREAHGYPPLRDLVQLLVSGRDAATVESAARRLAVFAESVPRSGSETTELELLGPAPAPIARVRDRFRWQLLLLGARDDVRPLARELLGLARQRLRGVSVRVDPGPFQML